MALIVDSSLVVADFLGIVRLVAARLTFPSSPRAFEVCAVLAVLVIGAAYETLFFALAKATPGMRYAGISSLHLRRPCHRAARNAPRRLLAMPLSVLPLGLGLAWALFDEDLLTWHDRLSETYLRKR